MNIFKICFSDESIEEDKIQEVIDELHLLGSTFWDDAETTCSLPDWVVVIVGLKWMGINLI